MSVAQQLAFSVGCGLTNFAVVVPAWRSRCPAGQLMALANVASGLTNAVLLALVVAAVL